MRKVFHGATRIVDSPLCHIGRDNLDFGKGFYICIISQEILDNSLHFLKAEPLNDLARKEELSC